MITCKVCGVPATVDGNGECYDCYKRSELDRLSEHLKYLENRGEGTLEEKEEILKTQNQIQQIEDVSQ